MKKILPVLILLVSTVYSFATTWTITTLNFDFVPDSITITLGDAVDFSNLGGTHDALEVSQSVWNANGNTPLSGGFSVPFGGGILTGLTVGTHYYVCSNHHGNGMKGRIVVLPGVQSVVIPNVWINEIHYDNAGIDTLEGFEIAGPAGTDLGCFRVLLYSGNTGQLYATHNLNGVIPDSACGYGTVWFDLPSGGLQNGNTSQNEPDGIVLEYAPLALACGILNQDTILQFLSYEGFFTATNGRATGLTSTNIGVAESSTSTPIGNSLQLSGTGTSYPQFVWNTWATSTYNRINNNQDFCGTPPPPASYSFNPVSNSFSESAGTVVAGYVRASSISLVAQTVDVVIKGGTGNAADINNYVTQTFTFSPNGIDSLPLSISIIDDVLVEGTENLVFALRNPSFTGTIGSDSLFTLTLTDNDVLPNPSVEFVVTSSSESEGVVSFQLAVSITNPNSNATSVDINVLGGGTATFGTDFSFSPLTVTFPPSSTFTQIVTVTIADDIVGEGNESFTFQLNFPTNNATFGTNRQHTVTIIDNDTLRFDINPASQTVNENAGIVTIPVNLSHISPNNTSVTVHLEVTGTSATQGTDFVFTDTTLVWPAGSFGPILLPVSITDDNLFEQDETIKLKLINPTNGATFLNDTFLLIIQNNDTLPSADCTNLFFSEYIEGSSNNKVLEIFNPTSSIVDLSDYKIFKSTDGGSSTSVFGLSGTLAPDSTYIAANPSSDVLITSKADTLSAFFDFTGDDALALVHVTDTIDIIGQIGVDPGTGWNLAGGSTENHSLIRSYYNYKGDINWNVAAGTWDVYPNDMFDSLGFHHTAPCGTPKPVPPASVRFTLLNDTVSESVGSVSVIVQIDNPSSIPVSVFIARDDNAGTTTAGLDYVYSNQSFSTNDGGTTFDTITITVLDERLIEPTETVVLHFLNVSANTNVVQDSTFTLYITDNDTLTSSFLGAGFSYVEKDTVIAVKVFLSTFPDTTVSVRVSVAPGNAVAGTDYIFSDTVLVFPANSVDTQVAWITILDDNIVEPNEQINFDLSDTNGLQIAISAYTLTIIDNDSVVGISHLDLDNSLQMFPNPVMFQLFIQTENDLQHTEITDLVGNIVMKPGILSAGRNSIDVSLLPAGLYFMNVHDEQKVFSRRFIKQD